MSVQLISKYRSQIMGVAIVWVMLYHFFGKNNVISWKNLFLAIGHGGVDIFLFVSGLGLVFALAKTDGRETPLNFIFRRFKRVIPSYFVVIIVSGIFLSKELSEVLGQLIVFGFFLPIGISSYDWYIPSLLVLYIIFPFYFIFFIKRPIKSAVFASLVGILFTAALVIIQKGTVILFFSRVPIFFAGTVAGYLILKKKEIGQRNTVLIILIGFISLYFELYLTSRYDDTFLRKTALAHIPFLFITPALCLLLSHLFKWLDGFRIGEKVSLAFKFMGMYSLEIYLIHMSMGRVPVLPSIIITVVLAVLLNKIVMLVPDKVGSLYRPKV